MYNLIRSEFFKLSKSLSFKILVMVMGVAGIMMALFTSSIGNQSETLSAELKMDGFSTFCSTLSDSALYMIMGTIFIGLFISSDFENRLFQDAIACGLSRGKLIVSKALVYYAALFVIMLPYPIVFTMIMTVMNGFGIPFHAVILGRMIMIFIISFLAYSAVTTFIIIMAFAWRRSGIVIGAGVGVLLFGVSIIQGVAMMVPGAEKLLRLTPFSVSVLFNMDAGAGDFLSVMLISLIYILVFLFLTYQIFRKAELK